MARYVTDDRIDASPDRGVRLHGRLLERAALGPERRRGIKVARPGRSARARASSSSSSSAGEGCRCTTSSSRSRRAHAFVVEAKQPSFTSRDTVTVAAAGAGSTVHYDAMLEFNGARRLLDPLMQLLFNRTGEERRGGHAHRAQPVNAARSRRRGARGHRRRQLHADRLRGAEPAVRLDAARGAAARRQDGDRHRRHLGPRS